MNQFRHINSETLAHGCTITLPNDVQAVPQLNDFVVEACLAVGFDSKMSRKIRLSVEEAVVNVMDYAYSEGIEGTVDIEVVTDQKSLKFIITDSGKPFDPTAKPEVDLSLPGEERQIGGLGIHLLRTLMDSVDYKRIDGKNILTLTKDLQAEI